MDSIFQPLIDFLQAYKNIPMEDREIIADHVTYREAKENDILLKEGRHPKELFFVCEGIIKIVGINDKSVDVTQFFVTENHLCTILKSFLNDTPANESILAATDLKLIVFNRDKLHQLYQKLPYFNQLITSITQQALLDKIQLRNAFRGEDATARYQLFLLRQPEVALRVSLSDVASYLGITQQSLSRIRKNMLSR